MIEVGVLGLDTSHPERFASILADRDDTTVSAVWDGGTVRDDTYVRTFCTDQGATRYDDPHAMIGSVDAVMILTVDWSSHRSLAVPFLEAGVPTLIDKPLVGSLADADAITDAAERGGASLYGGSAIPFHPAVSSLTASEPDTMFCSGYGDPFYYGVHLIDTVRMAIDSDWTQIEPIDSAGQLVAVHFVDGSTVTINFDGPEAEGLFTFLCVGDETTTVHVESTPTELDRMYEPFLDGFVAAIRGDRDDRDRLVDGAELLLGVQAALADDTPVPSNAGGEMRTSPTVDSSSFLADYEPYY